MSAILKKHAGLLKLLHKAPPKLKRSLLKQHSNKNDFVRCMSDCCYNILKGNIPLNRGQLSKLRRQKRVIRAIADKKTSLKKKKQIIQKGGFLAAILPPIIGALGSLFGGLLGSRH